MAAEVFRYDQTLACKPAPVPLEDYVPRASMTSLAPGPNATVSGANWRACCCPLSATKRSGPWPTPSRLRERSVRKPRVCNGSFPNPGGIRGRSTGADSSFCSTLLRRLLRRTMYDVSRGRVARRSDQGPPGGGDVRVRLLERGPRSHRRRKLAP